MFRSLSILLLIALPLAAADIPIRPVYFQTIPYDVLTDARGTPWFRNAVGIHNAKGELVCKAPEGRWLLADRAGRFWFATGQDQYTQKPVVRYYQDGKLMASGLHTSGGVWEDTLGRVFGFDGRAVHVMDDGNWRAHTDLVPPKEGRDVDEPAGKAIRDFTGEAQFVEDPKGRVWVWLRRGDALGGAWAFDGKKWTRHDIPGAADTDRVRMVLPFADDWFLLAVQPKDGDPNTPPLVPFSPSRTADQIARAKPFAGLPLDRMGYSGEALDGKRYFSRYVGYTAKGTIPSSRWSVTADGVAKELPDDDSSYFHLVNHPTGTSPTAGGVIFAKPGDRMGRLFDRQRHLMPCGRDADGRVYVPEASPPPHLWPTREYEYASHVVWPAKEAPGQVLRLTPLSVADFVFDLFRDSAGTAFARPYGHIDAVRRWDGKRWAKTPIDPLPAPKWEEKGSGFPPAELNWSGFGLVGHSTGADGRTLFARVKTRFKANKDGKFVPPPDDEKDPPPLWEYEAWTHKDGAWSDAHPPAELLKAKRKELIAGRLRPQPTPGPLPVFSDGTRLWSAQDWTLTVSDADGNSHTAAIPKPKRYVPPKPTAGELGRKFMLEMSTGAGPRPPYRNIPDPLMLAAILPLDARSVMIVTAGTPAKVFRGTLGVGRLARLTVEPLETDWPFCFPVLHAPADGPPLAWREHETVPGVSDDWIGMRDVKSRYDGGHDLYEFRNGKWVKRADLVRPQAISDDGALWCGPTDLTKDELRTRRLVLSRLHGGKVERFAWNYGEEVEGIGRPSAGAAVFAGNYELLCVEPPAKPGGKATLRAVPGADNLLGQTPVVLPDGTILTPHGHGKLFDPKK